jgi:LPS-assembly protein
MRRAIAAAVAGAMAVLVALAGPAARAQGAPDAQDGPALLQADEVVYDDAKNLVRARGNVEIARGERVLLTEAVTYNLETDVVRAEGDVTLLEPSGEVVFAERVELSGDLREGAVKSFRMLLTDRSRLAAANAVRVDGNRTVMRKVVFSPCRPCEDDPARPPLWQIKADKVVHDQRAKVLVYRHARLEVFGLPVAYAPYFEHPDPRVERKTGFLTPSLEVSEELGTRVDAPFYYTISPQRDITVTPIVTSEQGPALKTAYRARTEGGGYRITGSGTIADRETGSTPEDDAVRGHIDAEGRFNLSDTFRWGFRANRASDDTYKRIYDFGDERFLTSTAYVEGFHGDDYMQARAMAFQGQTLGDPTGELPFVLPELRYAATSDDRVLGGRAFLDAGFLGITRSNGRDSRRVSATTGWRRDFLDRLGGRLETTLAVRGDLYSTNGLDPGNPRVDPANARGSDLAGRLFPQVALSYAVPLARRSFLGREVLEPRVQVVGGPAGANHDTIPNEDSRDFNLEGTNLFELNRFPGRDRVSDGQRVDYGVSYGIHRDGGARVSTFVGQSYRIDGGDAIPESAGGSGGFSDIVGRVELHPRAQVDALYRFRIDETNFEARRHELALGVGPPKLRINADYTFLDDAPDEGGFAQAREEIFGRVSSRFARHWSAFAAHRRDIANGEPLETIYGLSYHDECFLLDLEVRRTFFNDREVDPQRSVFVRFALKHLGVFAGQ